MGQHEVKTICMRDCPDACSIIATVEDGRVIRQRGDPDHGVTRGFLCARGNAYLKRQYDPARLLYPLPSHFPAGGSGCRGRMHSISPPRDWRRLSGHLGAEVHPGGPLLRHARLGREGPDALVLGEARRRDDEPGRV